MAKLTKVNWQAWNEERERFKQLETNGFESDIQRLEAHIKKLLEVAPKDKAGWTHLYALDIISLLEKNLIKAKTHAKLIS